MVNPHRSEPLNLAVILSTDRNAVEYLQKMDRWQEVDGGWLWGGWYTAPKHAGKLLGKTSPHGAIANTYDMVLEGDIPLLKQLKTVAERAQLSQACKSQITASEGKRTFALSARLLTIMLLSTSGRYGEYARSWFRFKESPPLEEMLKLATTIPTARGTTNGGTYPTPLPTPKPLEVATRATQRPIPSPTPTPEPTPTSEPMPVPLSTPLQPVDSFHTIYCDAGVVNQPDLECTVLAAYDPKTGVGVIKHLSVVIPTHQAELLAIRLGHDHFPDALHIRTDNQEAIQFWDVYQKLDDKTAVQTNQDAACLYSLRGKDIVVYYVKGDENIVADYLTKFGRDPAKAGRYQVRFEKDQGQNKIMLDPLDAPAHVQQLLPLTEAELLPPTPKHDPAIVPVMAAVAPPPPSYLEVLEQEHAKIMAGVDQGEVIKQELYEKLAQLEAGLAESRHEAEALLPLIEMARRRAQKRLEGS